MTWQSEIRAWALASAGVFCLSATGYRVMTLPKLPDLNATVRHLDAATGAWADASKQQVQSVAAIERDLRAEMWHLDRSLTTVDGTLTAAQGAIGGVQATLTVTNEQLAHVGPLLDSARAATDSIPPVLASTRATIDAIPPAVTDFRDFLKQPAILDTLNNVDRMTGSGAGIANDAQKVSDKMTSDFLKPVKWYMYPIKKGGELIDIGSAIARHTP